MIDRILKVITVQDLMTDVTQLKRADDLKNAQLLFADFDVIPYPEEGEIKGYFHRDNSNIQKIETDIIVSNGTNIFELLTFFDKDKFCFVLSANKIVGYVHYSDLNKHSTKIPLFVLFESTERILWQQFKHRIKEKDLFKIFKEKEVKKFLKKREKNISKNVDIGWVGVFTFPYILRLANHYGLIKVPDKEIKLLKEIRNKIAHSDRNLIDSYSDIKQLLKALDLCVSINNETNDDRA